MRRRCGRTNEAALPPPSGPAPAIPFRVFFSFFVAHKRSQWGSEEPRKEKEKEKEKGPMDLLLPSKGPRTTCRSSTAHPAMERHGRTRTQA
ncbi:hypothetical protein NHX12_028852 [Muraenolepis orangiensis]|uniref:Uncharacterized protein n=1 Tax=Muraenolepis orangiensis TaxID=630683 RepID=A0A9Q0EE33_9TELE|nr:hypothetical protein NHX12_028852 [Muraenolepis orangiensis]